MATLGVMIEAQEGLDWDHWRRIATESDRLGFESLRCSDHCLSVVGVNGRRSLQTWVALALAAEWTERIQLGPMVSPMTFYVPAVLARIALAVDELSGGRVLLGVGTGWNQAEHEAMGIPFPSLRERFDNLEAGIARIHSTLELAEHPLPILIGGGGEKRTLTIAAREASEWNLLGYDPDAYRAKSRLLDERCREIGRDPSEIRRSVMAGHLIGRDQAELEARGLRLAEVLPSLQGHSGTDVVSSLRDQLGRWFVGTPAEIVEQMRPYVASGVGLFMLQHYVLDDMEALNLLASEVMPRLS
ncbi:MAG: LLM class flavin-dependent oxidoreductase [Candidatus Dormibacteraeota bacterium]|jgi:alkanesulfonate monooxygenase SsuD/methylene tetrahydromethanopterin reductase-like flavin-dependent oxidoreductase (luciferase family)|nr:LLM class flavin-dependent oxidoreductase [Candidatus Dormibacteraeota bacterium]